MKKNISKLCDEISCIGGFNYSSGHPESINCHPTWYAQNEIVLGHGMSLVQQFCVSGVRLVLRCFKSSETFEYHFQVTNCTAPPDLTGPTSGTVTEDNYGSGYNFVDLWLLILVPLLVLLLYCVWRNSTCRKKFNGAALANPQNTTKLEEKEETNPLNDHTSNTSKPDEETPRNCCAYDKPDKNDDAVMIQIDLTTLQTEEARNTPQNDQTSKTPNPEEEFLPVNDQTYKNRQTA